MDVNIIIRLQKRPPSYAKTLKIESRMLFYFLLEHSKCFMILGTYWYNFIWSSSYMLIAIGVYFSENNYVVEGCSY